MWEWFVNWLTSVLAALEGLTGDWGWAVIVLTIIIRLILVPLMTRSTASSARMQAMQPKLQEIQQRYADNPEKQAQELQKFYSENKFNPLGGCLPILLQMPIFFALFTVAKNVPADAHFMNILPSLSSSCSSMIAQSGWGAALPYIIFDAVFGILTFIPMMMNLKNTPEEQKSMQLTMGAVMAIMMLWFGWTVPAAVLLYYDASAIWQVAQQKLVTQRVMDRVKKESEAKLGDYKPVEVEVTRREKKPRPHKKN